MALMTNIEKIRCSIGIQRENVCPGGITKPDLITAIDAVDTWVENNAISFNSALPISFRTNATITQKVELLGYVLMRKIGKLKVEEDK